MKGRRLLLELEVHGCVVNELPPNCEVLARHYIGDWCFGLLREPHNRALFLIAPWGVWSVDVSQLVTTFGAEVQAWKRGDDVAQMRSLTGRIVPITHWLGTPPAYVKKRVGRGATAAVRRRRRTKV